MATLFCYSEVAMTTEQVIGVGIIITQRIYDGNPNVVEQSRVLISHALVRGGAKASTIEHQEPDFCEIFHFGTSYGKRDGVDPPHYHLKSTGTKWS